MSKADLIKNMAKTKRGRWMKTTELQLQLDLKHEKPPGKLTHDSNFWHDVVLAHSSTSEKKNILLSFLMWINIHKLHSFIINADVDNGAPQDCAKCKHPIRHKVPKATCNDCGVYYHFVCMGLPRSQREEIKDRRREWSYCSGREMSEEDYVLSLPATNPPATLVETYTTADEPDNEPQAQFNGTWNGARKTREVHRGARSVSVKVPSTCNAWLRGEVKQMCTIKHLHGVAPGTDHKEIRRWHQTKARQHLGRGPQATYTSILKRKPIFWKFSQEAQGK